MEELVVDGRIILEWILEKQDEKTLTGFIWIRINGNETLGFIQDREYDKLNN
jgi:hypothetical protein